MRLTGTTDYGVRATFECGQAFRFVGSASGGFRGVYRETVLTVYETENGIEIEQAGGLLTEEEIRAFLDYDRDYPAIQAMLIKAEPKLEAAIAIGKGIRLLKQEPFEALISFILSSNSNMKRIHVNVERLCEKYGTYITDVDGISYFAFPTVQQLKGITIEDYRALGFGYRAPYIQAVMERFESQNQVFALSTLDTKALHEQLLSFKGVGDKVASCVELFGFSRYEAFPVDIWIKRYFEWELGCEGWSIGKMTDYALLTFGQYAGLAQQYMFYFMLHKYKK